MSRDKKSQIRWANVLRELLSGLEFGFQSLRIEDDHAATLDLQHPFRLEAGKIPGDEFAHGADLLGQLLVAGWQRDFQTIGGTFPFGSSQTQQEGSQAVTHRSKRELLNNPYQPAQASPDHA